jgi:protein TonB
MANDPAGTVLLGTSGNITLKSFPKEFKRGVFARLEPRFIIILLCSAIVIFSLIGILSLKEPPVEISDQEIVKIQERYARLVLNQPKPEIEKPAKPLENKIKDNTPQVKAEEKKEDVVVNREKETYVEKQKRKETGTEERRQRREQVAKQIQSSGIFAAITAAGNNGGMGASASDLLGTASDGIGDLSDINISKGTFASKNVDPAELGQRKGSRTSDVGIERQQIGSAAVTQVATAAATVNITTAAPEVTGESSSHSERSQSVIGRVVNREANRLKRVFEDWLKRDPSLNGHLTVKFVILPSGAVSNVSIVKSSTNNSEFDEAILRYIRRWQFPAVPDGGPVEVVYPFVFEGQS